MQSPICRNQRTDSKEYKYCQNIYINGYIIAFKNKTKFSSQNKSSFQRSTNSVNILYRIHFLFIGQNAHIRKNACSKHNNYSKNSKKSNQDFIAKVSRNSNFRIFYPLLIPDYMSRSRHVKNDII